MAGQTVYEVLQTFYFNARQVNGQDYKTNSLETFRYGLNRYLSDDNNMPIDLINMPEFTMSNRNYKTAMNSLKAAGLGYTKHHEPLARDDLMKLYDIKYLNPQTAEGLARKVQFDIRVYMCRSGSENIYDMKKEKFCIKYDTDMKLKYIVLASDEKSKNHSYIDKEIVSGIMPQTNDIMCPVASFERYLSKLNPMCPFFWQRPRQSPDILDPVWFTNMRIGKNALDKFMQDMSELCHLTKKYTNHSLRATATSLLTRNKFAS
jgi:hypothetical protein